METLSSDPIIQKFLNGKKICSLTFNKQPNSDSISLNLNSGDTLTIKRFTSGPKTNTIEIKVNQLIVTDEPLKEAEDLYLRLTALLAKALLAKKTSVISLITNVKQ